jgi:hypothetical protein
MKILITAVCLGLLTLGTHSAYAQGGYPGGSGTSNSSPAYDPNMPDGEMSYNVAKANTKIIKFTVSWYVPVNYPNFGYVAHDVTAKGESTWNTSNRISYADLYGYYNPNSIVHPLNNSRSETSRHNSDLSGFYGVQWRAFRFRLGVWEKGGALEAQSNLRLLAPY